MSGVTCHLSPTPTTTATDPSPANSLIMQRRLDHLERTKKHKIMKTKIILCSLPKKGFLSFFNFSETLFDQKSPGILVPVANGGDTQHIHNPRTLQPTD